LSHQRLAKIASAELMKATYTAFLAERRTSLDNFSLNKYLGEATLTPDIDKKAPSLLGSYIKIR
jgi:hypothetical protein